ncbi:Dual specificity mitogen-activated protein kinase kinase dSOR1 [Galdieria sulphuraria]|nr:Dual specificity mitogen-activated protein kinase kinase dSOR1 [Galdieria sulphuraria]
MSSPLLKLTRCLLPTNQKIANNTSAKRTPVKSFANASSVHTAPLLVESDPCELRVVENDDNNNEQSLGAKRESTHNKRRSKKKPPPLQLSNPNLFLSSHHYEALGTFEVRMPTDVQQREKGSQICSNSCISPQELLTEFEWDNRVFSITHHGIRLSSNVTCFEELRFATSNPRKQHNKVVSSKWGRPSTQDVMENNLCESLQQQLVIADETNHSSVIGEVLFSPVVQKMIGHVSCLEQPSVQKNWSPSLEDPTRECNLSDFSLCTNTNPNSGYKTQDAFFDSHLQYSQTEAEYPMMEGTKRIIANDEGSSCMTPKDWIDEHYCPFPFHSLKLQGTIGIGRTCTVYKARRKEYPDSEIAVKVIEVVTSHAQRKSLLKELRVLFYTYFHPHPNIVEFYGACFLDGQVFIGLEYMPMGTLRHILSLKKQVDENFARSVAFQMVCALDYLHGEIRCIHRDIKPGNILFGTQGQVKLCDFGLASKGFSSKGCHRCKKHTFVGTTLYMAPEMLRGEAYDTKIDIWSLGMTIRESLGGCHPFRSILEESTSELDLFLRLEAAEVAEGCSFSFNKEEWKIPVTINQMQGQDTDLSIAGRDFLIKCLELKADDRPSAQELLQHPWFDTIRKEALDILNSDHVEWKDLQVAMRRVAQCRIVEALDWQQVRHHSKERSPILWST